MIGAHAGLAPDVPGAVIGWRAWGLGRSPDGLIHLLSLFGERDPWPPGAPAVAGCRRTPRAHAAPDPQCRCGLYAVPGPSFLPASHAPVVGTVSLWGTVVEHDRGCRAELAYPSSIGLLCERCRRPDRLVVREARDRTEPIAVRCRRHDWRRWRRVRSATGILDELCSTYGVEAIEPEYLVRSRPHRFLAAWNGLTRGARSVAWASVVAMAIALAVAAGGLAGTFVGAAA